jgi:hypothetical protein
MGKDLLAVGGVLVRGVASWGEGVGAGVDGRSEGVLPPPRST